MTDLSINTKNVEKSAVDEIKTNLPVTNTDKIEEDTPLITSEAIKNSKIDTDTITKLSNQKIEEFVFEEDEIEAAADNIGNKLNSTPNNISAYAYYYSQKGILPNSNTQAKKASDKEDEDTKVRDNSSSNEEAVKKAEERRNEEIKQSIEKREKEKKEAESILKKENLEKSEKKAKKIAETEKEVQQINNNIEKFSNKSGYTPKITKKNGVYQVERPSTTEFKQHDEFMSKIKSEYIKNNPEPSFSSKQKEESKLNDKKSESLEHSTWKSKYNKYMQKQEIAYQKENREYREQYNAYKNAKLKAEQMNMKLKSK